MRIGGNMGYFAPRDAETSLPCPVCGQNLRISRSCHQVRMRCPACRKDYPLADYIGRADENMEKFLENVYCDRI